MKFCDKLIELRRERGLSQEQLADLLDVSRQSVSKWESDQTMPELPKLVALSGIFEVSLDYLIRDNILDRSTTGEKTDRTAANYDDTAQKKHDYATLESQLNEINDYIKRPRGFEYKSKKTLFGLPLIHICFLYSRHRIKVAKGIIAIGAISVGFFSIGILTFGLLALGALALGLFSFGAISIGAIALGSIAIGYFSAGAISVGVYSLGSIAIAKEIAIGAIASGNLAIGDETYGSNCYSIDAIQTKAVAKDIILTHYPSIPKFLLNIFTLFFHS